MTNDTEALMPVRRTFTEIHDAANGARTLEYSSETHNFRITCNDVPSNYTAALLRKLAEWLERTPDRRDPWVNDPGESPF